MPYVVSRGSGRWELREASATASGPRSRTLASFRVLTPEVVSHALERSERPLSSAEIRRAAERAGVPIQRPAADDAAARLLAELSQGRGPSARIGHLLVDALSPQSRGATDSERAVAPWIAATLAERGEALRDLLLLADRLPSPAAAARRPSFPPLAPAER